MDNRDWRDTSLSALEELNTKCFTVTPALVNTGTIARRYFSIIQRICQNQVNALQTTGDYPIFSQAIQLQLALSRLDVLIGLKEAISKPHVTTLIQKNHDEAICRLHEADFSNIDTLLEFQSVLWWWKTGSEASALSDKSFSPNRYQVLYSIADALAGAGMECNGYLVEIDPLFLEKRKRASSLLQTVKQAIYRRLEGLDEIGYVNSSISKQKEVSYRI